jgi:ribonuclease HI
VTSKKKYYAVAVGRTRAILTKWFGDDGAEKQVRGYPGARYKSFGTLAEAEAYLKRHPPVEKRTSGLEKARSPHGIKGIPKASGTESGKIAVYTDGGALSNPGPGGYGVVIVEGDQARELSGGYRLTTNNRMELMACIKGLEQLKKPSAVILYSDSQYVVNGITKGWARKWQKNGWMRTKTEPALNPDLWEQLLALCQRHSVEFRWVKGHAGNPGNERCDALATRAASGNRLAVDAVYENTP